MMRRRIVIAAQPHLNTSNGVISTFNTPFAYPLKSCVVSFLNTSGIQGLTVTRAGKNLFDPSKAEYGYILSNGKISGYARNNKCAPYIPIVPGASMTGSMDYIVGDGAGSQAAMYVDKKPTITRRVYGAGIYVKTVTARSNEHFVRFYFNPGPGVSIYESTWNNINAQIEQGATATGFEPYTGTDYNVDWSSVAGTIYGGSIDLVSGKLVSSYAADGSLLPVPVEYQVSPVRISALKGINNIWSDKGDVITVDYWDI